MGLKKRMALTLNREIFAHHRCGALRWMAVLPIDFTAPVGEHLVLSATSEGITMTTSDLKPNRGDYRFFPKFGTYVSRHLPAWSPATLRLYEIQTLLEAFSHFPVGEENCQHRSHLMGVFLKLGLGLAPKKVYVYGDLRPKFRQPMSWFVHTAVVLEDRKGRDIVVDIARSVAVTKARWMSEMGEYEPSESKMKMNKFGMLFENMDKSHGTIYRSTMVQDVSRCLMAEEGDPKRLWQTAFKSLSSDLSPRSGRF
ncbi:MAG: hypothetical protein ACI9BD_000040 [Candidatus Marinamargulisbacteria bacterium]|jgi:hypothetical protein